MSNIQEAIAMTDYAEVAHQRADRGGAWEITTPDGEITVRVSQDDASVYVHLFDNGRAMINAGSMALSGHLAAPLFIAAAIDQIMQDYV